MRLPVDVTGDVDPSLAVPASMDLAGAVAVAVQTLHLNVRDVER